MAPGASGEYIESERFTRDPNQLAVGGWTAAAADGPLQLPQQSAPRVSRSLAAAVAALGAATLTGWAAPLPMVSIELGLGADWQLLTASLQPVGPADCAAAAAALATAGAYAEARLGSSLFAASFFLPGATAWVLYLVASYLSPLPLEACGPWPALLGSAAAMAAATAANWRVLGAAQQQGACVAAAAGLAAASLAGLDAFDAGVALVVAPLGGLLGWAAGPKLVEQEELDILPGSMTISGNEERLRVIVDHRTKLGRWLPIAAYAGLLGWVLVTAQAPMAEVADAVRGMDEGELLGLLDAALRALQAQAQSPEVQQRLFEAAPEEWARTA